MIGAPRSSVGRYSDNELVLFDEAAEESWIIYPPRSNYDFLHLRRSSNHITLVEHHPWAPFARIDDHDLTPENACGQHGTTCEANAAIQAAVHLGFNPFT